jgi:hypothetical protein
MRELLPWSKWLSLDVEVKIKREIEILNERHREIENEKILEMLLS